MSIFRNKGIDTNKTFVNKGHEFNTTDHNFLEKSGVKDIGFTGLADYLVQKQFDVYGEKWELR